MSLITEGKHAGDWLVSMPGCGIWHEKGKVVTGESRVLQTGTILMDGANPGEYTEWALDVSGAADPVAILFSADVDATVADVEKVVVAQRMVEANRGELVWPVGVTANDMTYAEQVLAQNQQIVVRDTCGE